MQLYMSQMLGLKGEQLCFQELRATMEAQAAQHSTSIAVLEQQLQDQAQQQEAHIARVHEEQAACTARLETRVQVGHAAQSLLIIYHHYLNL